MGVTPSPPPLAPFSEPAHEWLQRRGWQQFDTGTGATFGQPGTCTGFRLGLFEDHQRKAAIQFHPRSAENRPDGSGGTASPANDFTDIAPGNPQLQHRSLLVFQHSDGDRCRDVNQSSCTFIRRPRS